MADLPEHTRERQARDRVLADMPAPDVEPTSLVSYLSHGRLLIIGEEADVVAASESLGQSPGEGLDPWLWVPGAGAPARRTLADRPAVVGGDPGINGSLGQFNVLVDGGGVAAGPDRLLGERGGRFDLVLDLRDPPALTMPVPPVGYYAPRGRAEALAAAIEALPEMTGEFEKPKFFLYNPDICAHGRSGIKGCTRCIEACPTEAIVSAGDTVEVNPHLCQGGGSCVAACPSGAMSYAFPTVTDLMAHVRRLLDTYREAGGEAPVVAFVDELSAEAVESRLETELPGSWIPVRVEEIGSVGLDAWMTCLAYGARGLVLAVAEETPAPVQATIDAQLAVARPILDGFGLPEGLLQRWDPTSPTASASIPDWQGLNTIARFAVPGEKRTTLRLAFNHLHGQSRASRKAVDLPDHAPFGEVRVDAKACTLCMSCVGQCPTAALADGGGLPQLNFTEWNCVQCGICVTACPEDAIDLKARLVLDPDVRQTRRVLHEEQPFCCVSCGKPFATRSVLEVMKRKLESHWMFQNEEARRRLEMCDTCRVKDLARAEMEKGGPPH